MIWLKVSADLPRHAKLYKLARRLDIPRRDALAYLVQLWAFVVMNYPDGNISATPDEIAFGVELDEKIDPTEFVNALCDCASPSDGFLERVAQDCYHVHDWDEFSGSLEIAKTKNREKLRAWREKKKIQDSKDVTVTEPLHNGSVTSKKEKEKEKEKENNIKRLGGVSSETPSAPKIFSDIWVEARHEEIRKVVENPKPKKLPELIGQWREVYGQQAVEKGITHALRWLRDNGKRYTDMGKFLGGWLARDAEKAPATGRQVDYGDTLPSWEELRGTR